MNCKLSFAMFFSNRELETNKNLLRGKWYQLNKYELPSSECANPRLPKLLISMSSLFQRKYNKPIKTRISTNNPKFKQGTI